MGYKCAAFGCTSGYKGYAKNSNITFHSFPLANKELCDRWNRANPRKNFSPTPHSRICSLHFRPCDFVEERTDSNAARRRRKAKQHGDKLVKRYLKDDAVPSSFPHAPEYLSTKGSGPRETVSATASSRLEQEARRLDVLEQSFHAADDISSDCLDDIALKLQMETALPHGFTVTKFDTVLLIYLLQVSDCIPTITACITVQEDLSAAVSLAGKSIAASQFSDLFKGPLRCMSHLVNLMARVKSMATDLQTRPMKLSIGMAISYLQECLENIDNTDCDEYHKINFIIEQLKLLSKHKQGRHYSPELTIMSYRIRATSTAAYKALVEENILCIPSLATLNKVTRRLSNNSCLDNTSYLKLRVSKLTPLQRNVVLIIDEIYIAKRVEYFGGEVKGLTSDGEVASTLLCFMVKSLASKYRDLVAIYPMCKLTAAKQNACYQEVHEMLRNVDLSVVAISCDNATVNRKFFIDHLCGGTLHSSFQDPVTNQPIFLLFDPVHDLKNIYNNFQSRKTFVCPPMAHELPTGCTAKFQDIVDLYNLEATSSLKKAHRLSPSTLYPKSIEKTSVKLAISVFCESTRDALRFYSSKNETERDSETASKPKWTGTADFITLILKLWNVMNVKNATKGKHKRDYTMDPVRNPDDWKLAFLGQFTDFLLEWETSGKSGLTRETFLALKQTCIALKHCASYLLTERGFNFVLLGNLQSDPIENRFGWLRQLSGANYFISMRQVLDSDRKIRAVSLVKFSGFTLAEIDDAISASSQPSAPAADRTADALAESLTFQKWPSESDLNIIFYISGAIARSVFRSLKCADCKETLVDPDHLLEPPQLDESSSNFMPSTFLDSINRGGLSRPSEYCYTTSVSCWRVYEEIRSTAALKDKLLSVDNQRKLFINVVERATENGQLLVEGNFCFKGHDLREQISMRFFNCVAKNLAKELTAAVNLPSEKSAKKRKIAKLTSKQHCD